MKKSAKQVDFFNSFLKDYLCFREHTSFYSFYSGSLFLLTLTLPNNVLVLTAFAVCLKPCIAAISQSCFIPLQNPWDPAAASSDGGSLHLPQAGNPMFGLIAPSSGGGRNKQHDASCKYFSWRSELPLIHWAGMEYSNVSSQRKYHSKCFLLLSPRLPLYFPCQRGCEPAGSPQLTVWWSHPPQQVSAGGHSAQFLLELCMLLQPAVHYCCLGRNLDGNTYRLINP